MKSTLFIERWELPAPPDKFEHNGFVNLLSDPDDYHVVILAAVGMNYSVISRQTGLSHGQISYRLSKANKHRKPADKINAYNYRNGISPSSQAVIELASRRVSRLVNPELRKSLAIGNEAIDV